VQLVGHIRLEVLAFWLLCRRFSDYLDEGSLLLVLLDRLRFMDDLDLLLRSYTTADCLVILTRTTTTTTVLLFTAYHRLGQDRS